MSTIGVVFGGNGLLQGLVAALGAALFVGNVLALWRSRKPSSGKLTWSDRQNRRDPQAHRPPVRRGQSAVMATLGLGVFVWATASLIKG